MRVIGLDVARTVAEVAYLDGGVVQAGGRVELVSPALQRFAKALRRTDEVVLEATGNTSAIVASLKPYVAKVIVANPLQVRLIAEARVKTDKIDAAILAQLYASGFLPEVWVPDTDTQALRRQVARRSQIVRQRTRLKNEIHAVLAAHLLPRCPAADLFGKKGRAWLTDQPLPLDERLGLEQRLRELDRLGEDLTIIDRQLGESVLEEARIHQLLTITGVNTTVAITLLAAIGDIARFRSPEKLVSYFGLNLSVYPSRGCNPPSTAISASAAAPTHGRCWSKKRGPRPRRPDRCAPSSSASANDVACKSPPWPPPANWPSSSGMC